MSNILPRETFLASFNRLKSYCEAEDFAGWDPYDGLNSRIFQATPLRHWDIARLVWIQGFKRCPVNLRRPLLVPKEHNAKGIALFLSGYCNIYRAQQLSGKEELASREALLTTINRLARLLLAMQSTGYGGACWGYNFDWQARRLFLFPKQTPTAVATAFCVMALLAAYQHTGSTEYLETALSAASFVLGDLQRTPKKEGFLFSYSPLPGNNTVYNASLLASLVLSHTYRYTSCAVAKAAARDSILACVSAQRADGAWVYGELPVQRWIDSFHTGYNLDALQAYQEASGDTTFAAAIDKGFTFYIENFFLPDGTPKYYHDRIWPIDSHCPGQLLVTLHRLHRLHEYRGLADTVLAWAIARMQHKKGYFYYQLKGIGSSKISYMRWSNAFMFHAMSCYLLGLVENQTEPHYQP